MFRSPIPVIGFLSLFVLGGCAEYMQEVRREACVPQRMYERGYNDARAGREMNAPGGCTDTSVFTRYREGYFQARAEQERQASLDSRKPAPSQVLPPTVQVVDASHAKGVVVVNAPSPPAKGYGTTRDERLRQDSLQAWEQRFWLCRVEAFGKTFSGEGATGLEAKEAARSNCLDRYGVKFCSDVSCAVDAR